MGYQECYFCTANLMQDSSASIFFLGKVCCNFAFRKETQKVWKFSQFGAGSTTCIEFNAFFAILAPSASKLSPASLVTSLCIHIWPSVNFHYLEKLANQLFLSFKKDYSAGLRVYAYALEFIKHLCAQDENRIDANNCVPNTHST